MLKSEYVLNNDVCLIPRLYGNVLNTGIGTKHFTLGVPVPVIKAMCRIPVPRSSFPTLRYRVG